MTETQVLVSRRARILALGCGTVHGVELEALLREQAPDAEIAVVDDLRDLGRTVPARLVLFGLPTARRDKFLADLRRRCHNARLVALLARPDVETLGQLMRAGVHDYLVAAGAGEISQQIGELFERAAADEEARRLAPSGSSRDFRELGLVGRSRAIRATFAVIRKAAESNVTVLITGESGTGKELVARAIHQLSGRREHGFVPVNCGAIPKPLVESELFGHVRGAFSGAIEDKLGLLAEAEGGTLFLDEICDLPLEMQVKINRVLQEREVRRLGDTVEQRVDVRFVAASNKNFEEEIRQSRFREDLYFRLNVLRIDLPALRDRSRDVVHLAEHFVRRFSEREGKVVEGISPPALKALLAYSWPGNVRELENAIERAVLLARGNILSPEDLPAEIPTLPQRRSAFVPNYSLPYNDAMARLSQEASQSYVEEVLARYDGNVTRAARHAQIPRESLHRLMRRYGIRSADHKRGTPPPAP